MTLLRRVTDDEVGVPQVNRMVRYLFGAVAFFCCAMLVMLHGTGPVQHPIALSFLTSLSAAIGGACFSWVSVVRINCSTKTITRRWGFFFAGSPTEETIEPTAVRLLVDTHDSGHLPLDHHLIMLVHAKGQSLIRTSWCLDSARRLAEELSDFLETELYEDRLTTKAPWFKPLMGIGIEPGQWYIGRSGQTDARLLNADARTTHRG